MNEKISSLLQRRWTLPTITGIVGVGVGVAVGYLATKRQYDKIQLDLETLQDEQSEFNESIAEAAQVSKALKEQGEVLLSSLKTMAERRADVTPQPVVPSATGPDISESVSKHPSVRAELDPELEPDKPLEVVSKKKASRRDEGVVVNIFDNGAGDEWDYRQEIQNRDKSRPYIIHVDEFVADEMGWDSQSTLTWYEKDQVLCDSHDKPIYNHQEVVGELLFGHGSNDANVVYVRNEQLQAEYEILRDDGSYEEVVLGEEMERQQQREHLRHSANLKFRRE